jgi:hypothetical protein
MPVEAVLRFDLASLQGELGQIDLVLGQLICQLFHLAVFQRADVVLGGVIVDGFRCAVPADRVPENGQRPEQQVDYPETIFAAVERATAWQQAKCGTQGRVLFLDHQAGGFIVAQFGFLIGVQTARAAGGSENRTGKNDGTSFTTAPCCWQRARSMARWRGNYHE